METYHGHVRAPADAIILFEACRIGLLPRVQRRLSEKERQSIKSGSIFVWDEREAGMRRWTDGKSWSASRVAGSFLTYREMEGKRGGGSSMSAPLFSGNSKKESAKDNPDQGDDGPDGYRYKPDGLMKQSFSITTSSGQHLHLISYYSRTAMGAPNLMQPSADPQLRHIRPEKGMYPESTVPDQNNIPAVTRGPMTSPGFAPSPHQPANLTSPYGRPAPSAPHYSGYHHAGWAPPSPMHTPPPNYAPYYPGGHSQPHPQPHPQSHQAPQVGQSPLQQVQYPQYAPQYPAQPPSATAFDRAPAPLSNSALPPPPQPYQLPSHHQHSYGPPPSNYAQPPRYEQQPSHIDPKLNSSTGPRHDSVHPTKHHDESHQHAPVHQQHSTRTSSPPSVPHSSAQTIPSIHSLINGAQAANEEYNRARTGSRSPGNGRQLQDIPIHKIGSNSNSDARALRDLDKATFRV